ncbi:hypothetical protein AQUCO_05300005v1 [Aquilegia coerulea]|uniref:Uncharacterized protein n=1 Tax=Aquilegia coerulea TaxID=218851 RepID=A0A2G5CHW9_AQUCA|nr:hypothetical protein AQUCO_05300005v1 [Aquilegia coerulea]
MLTPTAFSLDLELAIGIIVQISGNVHTFGTWTKLVLTQFVFPIVVFVFSLLSTAVVVFSVASLYNSRNVSFITILAAVPRIFRRLFITFLFISVLVILYQVVYFGCMIALSRFLPNLVHNPLLVVIAEIFLSTLFYGIHCYIVVIWHLASVISVLEPVYGFASMKSKELLKGRTWMAIEFGYDYLLLFLVCCTSSEWACGSIVAPLSQKWRGCGFETRQQLIVDISFHT